MTSKEESVILTMIFGKEQAIEKLKSKIIAYEKNKQYLENEIYRLNNILKNLL